MNYKFSIIFVVVIVACTYADDVQLSTKNHAGLHCIVEAVYTLQDNVGNFENDVKLCGTDASATVTYVLNNSNDLLRITSRLVDLNANICNKGAYNDVKDAQKVPSQLCINDVGKQMAKLKKTIRTTVREINAVKKGDGCVTLNLANYKLGLNIFDTLVKKCVDVAKQA